MPKVKFNYFNRKASPSPAFPERKSLRSPIIPITVMNGEKKISVLAFVDSGADNTVLSHKLCDLLDIRWETGKEETIRGVSGEPQKSYFHSIKIEVGGHVHDCYVGFMAGLSLQGGLLGQHCFFNHFKKVIFDHNAGEVELVW